MIDYYFLSCLENGDFSFIEKSSIYFVNDLIKEIRKSPNKEKIIDGFIDSALDVYPGFCFNLIYDIPKFQEKTLYLYKKYKSRIKLTKEKLLNILKINNLGKEFLKENLDEIILSFDEETINEVFNYLFTYYNKDKNILGIPTHKNLHIRYLFMNYIIKNHPNKLNVFYNDITKYLSCDDKIMNEEDISNLAISILDSNLDKNIYKNLKEFILVNFGKNNLAKLLLQDDKKERKKEFISDNERLFNSSLNYKLEIYQNHTKLLTEEILSNFSKFIEHFRHYNFFDKKVSHIFENGLGDELKLYVEKYLSLSKNTTSEFIGKGTTTSCYRVGDYVIKLIRTKWSFEEEICPNLYLILKNEEEKYLRDEKGIVIAGLEVQKHLTRRPDIAPSDKIESFDEELKNLGYYCTDSYGYNLMMLDSYLEADCNDPEKLPDYFKQNPIVLADRDRVYRINNKKPKQLSSNYR